MGTGPDGDVLGETALTEPAATLRILTIGEHVEVYADGVFALTALCYWGHPAPWTAVSECRTRTVPVRPIGLPAPDPDRDYASAATTPRPRLRLGRDYASAVWPGLSAH